MVSNVSTFEVPYTYWEWLYLIGNFRIYLFQIKLTLNEITFQACADQEWKSKQRLSQQQLRWTGTLLLFPPGY